MQVPGTTRKFSLPDVSPPFVTVLRLVSSEGVVDRNRPHFHPDTIEICAVLKGQLDWFIAEETFTVKPGDILTIPARIEHGAVDSNLQPCEIVAVHLAPEQLPDRLAEAATAIPPQRLRHPEISGLLERIYDEHLRGGPYLPDISAALATLLVTALAEFDAGEEDRKNSRLIRQAKRMIMGENGIRPTVDEVADRLGVSSVWLHKLFVRETGASPGDWARARRLSDAKRMLEEGALPTLTIALNLGYATGQSFATAFRKESGMTPSEYRSRHSGERSRRVYEVTMRETWIDDVRHYPLPMIRKADRKPPFPFGEGE